MNIGFYENHLSIRGMSVALFDYAHYNETLLKNNSFIITKPIRYCVDLDENSEVHEKFKKRFNNNFIYINELTEIQKIIDEKQIKILYVISHGRYIDSLGSFNNCKIFTHCVFNTDQKNGDYYCAISPYLNKNHKTNIPVMPHLINLLPQYIKDFTDENLENVNLRKELGIPDNAYVIGRYGGFRQFSFPFVKNVVKELSYQNNNLFFLFMNTEQFPCNNKKCLFLPSQTSLAYKYKFVNTCNALLHARADGETFGLTVGEFAINKKQIITFYIDHPHYATNHIDFLGNHCHKYRNDVELKYILNNIEKNEINMDNNKYLLYTPEKVMKLFEIVFNKLANN
jgi:hypothetical protein